MYTNQRLRKSISIITVLLLLVTLLLPSVTPIVAYASTTVVSIPVISNSALPRIDINFNDTQTKAAYKNKAKPIDFYDLNKEDYADAMVSVSNAGEYNVEAKLAGVRGRGNSTWNAPKKPVRIKFDKKTSMFGEPAAKSWTLLANYYDKTLLHNITAYNLYAYLGADFSSIAIPVDVYVNGTYYGVYTLCDQMQVGDGRVELSEDFTDDPADTDYFLEHLQSDKLESDKVNITSPLLNGYWLELKSPEKEEDDDTDITAYVNYIRGYLADVNAAIGSKDWDLIQSFIDVDTFVQFFLTELILPTQDSGWSMYMSKASGGKLKLGPIWDFDLLAGTGAINYNPDVLNLANTLFTQLMNVPEFYEIFSDAYFEQYEDAMTNTLELIDKYYQDYGTSFANDFNYWGNNATWASPLINAIEDYNTQFSTYRDWLIYRFDWLAWYLQLRADGIWYNSGSSSVQINGANDVFTVTSDRPLVVNAPHLLSRSTSLTVNGTLILEDGASVTMRDGAILGGTGSVIVEDGAELTVSSELLSPGRYKISDGNLVFTFSDKLNATYGDTLSDIALPDGFSWEDDGGTPVGNVGTNYFTVSYTPDNTDKYTIVTGISVAVTVAHAIANQTNPTGKTLEYTGVQQALLVAGESENGVYKYGFDETNITLNAEDIIATEVGGYSVYWTFTPNENYIATEMNGNFQTVIGEGAIAYSATGYDGAYDGQPHIAVITATTPADASIKYGTQTGLYVFDESPVYIDAGTYTVYFKISAPNYNAVENSVVVEIAKADQSAPDNLNLLNNDVTEITLNAIENAEYSKDGSNWQDSPVFTELTANTEYTFYARIKGDDNHNASPASEGLAVKTEQYTYNVIFKDWDGSILDEQIVVLGEDAVAPEVSERTGYEFLGWDYYLTNVMYDMTVTAQYRDIAPPTGEIKIGTSTWSSLLDTDSFGLFFKETQTVTITATDNGGGDVVIEYSLDNDNWIPYDEPFSIAPNQKLFIYARLKDSEFNTAYLRTDGIALYSDSGVEQSEISFNKEETPDVSVDLVLNGNTLADVVIGDNVLAKETDYTLSESTLTFKAEYFESLETGDYTIALYFAPLGIADSGEIITASIGLAIHPYIPNTAPPVSPEPIPNPTPTPAPTPGIPMSVDDETGEVVLDLIQETVEQLIAEAIVKAREQDSNAKPSVVLDISAVETAQSAILDSNSVQIFADAGISIVVALPTAVIFLDSETLIMLSKGTDGDAAPISIQATTISENELTGMQAAQVKSYETVINVDIFVGDTKMDVPITVSLPYTLKENEDPNAVCVWHLDDDGNLTKLEGVYNAETGMITFTINHQSYFVVGYDPVALWTNIFSDISKDKWYYDAVAYANYYGLFAGDGNGNFMPTDGMTRAMFVIVLWNLEGKPSPNNTKSFVDVAKDEWYYDAVIWAAENSIVNGVGGGRYDPAREITRQEMAVMLCNYVNFKKYEMPVNKDMPDYIDAAQVDIWAENAAVKLSKAGVMSGDKNAFMPQKTATRAEVAQLFKNFLRYVP